MIHYKKSFASYLFFDSSLVGMCPKLQIVRTFGTNGEKPLSDAFKHEFSYSQHLTCFIHVRRNITQKLKECNVPSETSRIILNDIFGHRVENGVQEGLVDASSEDFNVTLEPLCEKWRKIHTSSSSDIDSFISWFLKNKREVISDTMLRNIREDCGLGDPPDNLQRIPMKV